MTDALAVAVVGGLVGGTIASIVGAWVTLRNADNTRKHEVAQANAARQHELQMAREERLQERRSLAYERILTYAYRLAMWVDRIEPVFVIGAPPVPPDPVGDKQLIRLNAMTSAHASREVQDRQLAVTRAARRFQTAVWRLNAEREAPRSTEVMEAWQAVDEARGVFRTALDALADQAGRELRSDA